MQRASQQAFLWCSCIRYLKGYPHLYAADRWVGHRAANSVDFYVEFKFEFSLFCEFEFKFKFNIFIFASSSSSSSSVKIYQVFSSSGNIVIDLA